MPAIVPGDIPLELVSVGTAVDAGGEVALVVALEDMEIEAEGVFAEPVKLAASVTTSALLQQSVVLPQHHFSESWVPSQGVSWTFCSFSL